MTLTLILALIAYEALMLIIHWTVYATLVAAFGIGSVWLKGIFIFLSLTFVLASVLSHYKSGKFVDLYYKASAYWFGLAPFLFGGGLIFYIVLAVSYAHSVYVSSALVGGIAFGAVFLLHLYGTWNSQHVHIKKYQVKLSDHVGFQADFWKGKKVIFVSDFQLGNIYRSQFTAKVVRKINARDPYLVLIGGDLYDGVHCDEVKIIEPLKELHPAGGTYFITGNHEYYLPNVPRAMDAIRGASITVLNNEKVDIGGIELIGVDYSTTHKKDEFAAALAKIGVDRSKPSIMMKHEPSYLDIAASAGVSLDLSGHTHRGQIFPLMFFTRQMYKGLDYGLKRTGDMQVITSSGVGTWGAPLRLGTNSEVVEMEFV